MTTATSLLFIAFGAILAFAVSFQVAGISIHNIGVILMLVGILGLTIALATLAGYAPWGRDRVVAAAPAAAVAPPVNAGPPTSV